MFRRKPRPEEEFASALYLRTAERARAPFLFGECGIPDTLDGRFDALALHALLGEPRTESAEPSARFLVLRHHGADWVFPVDAVSGVHDVPAGTVEPLPATMSMAGGLYATGIAPCGAHATGLLDEDLLVRAIERTLA